MKRHHLTLIAIGAGIVLSSVPASAQSKCREGKLLNGACANAPRAEVLRQGTIVFTQPKLSYTGPPVPVGAERRYDATRDRQLGLEYELFGRPGVGLGGVPC